MPLFRCSCILGGRCNQIKADEDIPEIVSNNRKSSIDGKSEGINVVNENEMEQALLYLYRPCIGSLSLGMMVHRPGILIHRDLILTSHGNLPSFDTAVDGEFVLCYLPSSRRRRSIPPKTILTRQLEPHRCFLTSEALDLTLIACEAVPENITEVIPLSIHQHLGSMDLLEAGHQVYVLGHLQSNEMKGILASGSGCTTIFPWKDTSSNTLVAFTREPKKGINGLWMPGSAGFDEQGEFSFMVAKPQLSSTSNNSNANTAQESNFKRKSLENTTTSNITQYGVPLYVIQDWMLMHGIRDLDNLPPPIQLSDNMSNVVTPTIGSRSMDESPLIPHGSLPLSDRNSINYVVMNASRLLLESQPRRNSSPLESFISYEPSCVGNETPLQMTSIVGLEVNSVITTKEEDSLNLQEKSFELPGEGNNVKPVLMQDTMSAHDFQRSISEKVTSRPLKWHSRTSLPPSYKTNSDNSREYEWLRNDEKSILALPKVGLNQDKELNIKELQARLSSSCVSRISLPHEQHSNEDSGYGSAPIGRGESNVDDNCPTLASDVGEQIYEEISLETPKSMAVGGFTTGVDETKQFNVVSLKSLSDDFRIKEANEVSSKEGGVGSSTRDFEPDQKEASVPIEMDSREDKQGQHTAHLDEQAKNTIEGYTEREKWDHRMEPLKGHEEVYGDSTKVDNILNVMNANQQYVPNTDIEQTRTSQPTDGLIMVSEENDDYIGCDKAMNMGAILNERMQRTILNVGAIPSNSMSIREFNVGSFPNDDMSTNALNAGAMPNYSMLGKTSNNNKGMKKQPYSPASPASSTHISSPLRPEEVSKRIQGYGNVSNIMQSANMRNTSSKEEKGGGRRSSSGSSSGPPLKSLFLDVGSSLVSGRWIKSSSSSKAPHFDDSPS